MVQRGVDKVHEFEDGTGPPGKFEWPVKGVAEEDIVGGELLQKPALDLDAPCYTLSVCPLEVLVVVCVLSIDIVEPFYMDDDFALEKVRGDVVSLGGVYCDRRKGGGRWTCKDT